MKALVLGLGISGKAAALYLRNRGDEVLGVDRVLQTLDGIVTISEAAPIQLEGIDLVVKSPGVRQTHPWVEAARMRKLPVVGEIDLAFAELKNRGKAVFGVTGSNGKTTTTLMTAHLLNTSGKKAIAAGNVGIPLIAQIDSDAEVFVVELSSFQLEQIVANPVLDKAVILNITANHLDRHPSFEDYCQAKLRIATCLKENAPLFVSKQAAQLCGSKYAIFDSMQEKVETICSLGYRDSVYPHDLENISAAYALASVPVDALKRGVATFIRPPHRLEFVRKVAGVAYINDSKATSVDAVIKAVQAIPGPIILIAGGVDKGGAFCDWLPHFKGKVVRVVALGEASKRIERELSPLIVVHQVSSLAEGVHMASKIAEAGDTVLLSPGCSSYDQWIDYEHRGEAFRQIVEEFAEERL
jgi:UDP-N-acetylmuramoylalanine--D-glutamate ligase